MASDRFRIAVSPLSQSNDHQVRFFVDGEDLIRRLWGDMLGLDPWFILREPCPLLPGALAGSVTVARCSCGAIDCGSEEVFIAEGDGAITWIPVRGGSPVLTVANGIYIQEVERFLHDTSWETPDRTAERLFTSRFHPDDIGALCFRLEWVSGRVRKDTFTVALDLRESGTSYQILVHIPWPKVDPRESPLIAESLASEMVAHLAMRPEEWTDVQWIPGQRWQGRPKCAGGGWRRWQPVRNKVQGKNRILSFLPWLKRNRASK
jgi:hypothetical protein